MKKHNKMKETLEEAAEKFANDCTLVSDAAAYEGFIEAAYEGFIEAAYEGFIEGALWQAERMYSEEEVLCMLLNNPYQFENNIKEWFDQFKKK